MMPAIPLLPPAKMNAKQALCWSLAFLFIGFLTPSAIIFSVEVFVANISPIASAAGILRRQFSEGDSLFLLAVFSLIPFFVLSLACFALSLRLHGSRFACVAIGGLLGILGLMVPAHVSVWYPLAVDHGSSTSIVAFILIPFLCIASLAAGLFVGWLVSLLPAFRTAACKD